MSHAVARLRAERLARSIKPLSPVVPGLNAARIAG